MSESTTGGALGKLVGRAKEVTGSMLGREDLQREGKLQQVQSEAEREAAERAAEAEKTEREAELESEKAEVKSERREVELEAGEMAAEEQVENAAQPPRQQVPQIAPAPQRRAHALHDVRVARLERAPQPGDLRGVVL